MKQRIITGLILIVVALLWLFSGYELFLAGAFFIVSIAGYEFGNLIFAKDFASKLVSNKQERHSYSNDINRIPKSIITLNLIYAFSVLLITSAIYLTIKSTCGDFTQIQRMSDNFVNVFSVHSIFSIVMSLSGLWWLLTIFLVFFYPKSATFFKTKFIKAICGYLTIIPFFFSLLFLRVQSYDINENFGAYVLLSFMSLVWAADSGAYFAGRLLGKHKMSPNVSPNKTIEGLVGGLILSAILFVVIFWVGGYGGEGYSFAQHSIALVISVIILILISVVGDLAESMFKRDANIKDSGVIFPGHGGMLDRIDSLTAALPCFLVVYALFL